MFDSDKCMSFFLTKPLLLRCRKSSRLLMTSSTSRSSSLVTGGCLWGVRPLSASMDNGFPILDAFNDDQAFERHFGSFLDDASNQLPVSGSFSKSRSSNLLKNTWNVNNFPRGHCFGFSGRNFDENETTTVSKYVLWHFLFYIALSHLNAAFYGTLNTNSWGAEMAINRDVHEVFCIYIFTQHYYLKIISN